jgi:CheY-like chemotaxis protein
MAPQENMARRILLVDDEPMVLKAIQMILAQDGHEVETAASSQEALAAFQRGRFDLVITDYEMPVMTGDKLAAAIKALVPHQPILLITAYAERLCSEGTSLLAVDLVLSKPFDAEKLREVVRQLTGP